MLRPNQTKFKKSRKYKIKNNCETKTNELKFGIYGLQALEIGKITAKQIEAVRRTITGFMKRKGKVWIRIFPDLPVSEKPTEVRMGKGKGNVSYWVAMVKPGRILFEVSSKDINIIEEALKYASIKLPIKTQIISRTFKMI
jgi:large subunit ribosomal protein L16